LNVNGSFTLGTVTGTNSGTGFTPGPYSNGGAGQEDGFGVFNLTINSHDGFPNSASSITVSLSGGSWSSAANVLTANNDGESVAAHIFVTSSPANASNGALATGFAADSPATPEPSTMAIAGFGALGFVGYCLRRRLKK
jgi:hypothetical protein